MLIQGYQERINDQREVWAHFTAALINSSRTKKDKKVKAEQLFDREELDKRRKNPQPTDPGEVRIRQKKAQERAARLPLPRKLRHR